MRYLEEYKAANVPMLPVVAKNEVVGRQIILYAWAYLASTLLLIPVADMGIVYSAVAVIAGRLVHLGISPSVCRSQSEDSREPNAAFPRVDHPPHAAVLGHSPLIHLSGF